MYVYAPNQTLQKFPYSLEQLKKDNPFTSWPKVITDEMLASVDTYRVTPTPAPQIDHTINLDHTAVFVNGAWLEQWIQTPATAEEITQRTEAAAKAVREMRDQMLRDSDWVVGRQQELAVKDSRTPQLNEPINTYRQALRDISNQPGFPHNIVWPTQPEVL